MSQDTQATVPYAFEALSTGAAALLVGLDGPVWAGALLTGAGVALALLAADRARGLLGWSAPARARLAGTLAAAGSLGLLGSAWTLTSSSVLAGVLVAGWGLFVGLSALGLLTVGEGPARSEAERREAFEATLRSTVEGGRR